MLKIWNKLTRKEKKYLRDKYIDLTTDRDPYSSYDDWGDVGILEELFGEENLTSSSTEPSEEILIASKEKALSIYRWAKECSPDNEEAQITLSVLESLFSEDDLNSEL